MPDHLSGRVLAVFFWFTLLIVSNIYKGNLIASLATFTPKLPLLTLEEVAADRQYTILMVNDSSQRTLLEVPSLLIILVTLESTWLDLIDHATRKLNTIIQQGKNSHSN